MLRGGNLGDRLVWRNGTHLGVVCLACEISILLGGHMHVEVGKLAAAVAAVSGFWGGK